MAASQPGIIVNEKEHCCDASCAKYQVIPEPFKNDVLSSAYASNLEPLVLEYQPDYWVHGHIHHPIKYHIGDTIVLCNPHGYIDEPYNGFDKNLIIEI